MMNRKLFNKSHFAFFISAVLLFSSCGVWENFTTYFNLYYNTLTLFEDAEKDIFSQKRELFSTEPLLISGSANSLLVKVIEKSSKILQFRSESGYVDEALIMLGKSFFYQKNFQKSRRKFEELLLTNPDDEIRLEADLWIAKCNMRLKEYTTGLKELAVVRTQALEEDELEILSETYYEEVKYHILQENYESAISLAKELIPISTSSVIAQIYFELGNLYAKIDDKENAILSYESVFEYSPDFDLEIEANIKYAKALRDGDYNDEALEEFLSMRNKDKFFERFNEIDVEKAATLEKLGRFEEAAEEFKIIDTTYKNTPYSAAASYFIGKIYENHLLDYDSAGVYYSKASISNPPKEYLQPVREKNQIFQRYASLRRPADSYNRQFFYAENPDIFEKDSIEYVEDSLKILDEYLAQKELLDIWTGVDSLLFRPDSNKIKDSLLTLDSLRIKDSLYVRDSLMVLFDQGIFDDTLQVNDSLNVILLAKRQKEIEEKKLLKDPRSLRNFTGVNLDTIKFKNNPPKKPIIPLDSVKYIISKSQLELGNLFLAELNVPDSAYNLYMDNIGRFPESQFYPNTLYALGSYYLTINNKPKADSLFQVIYDNHKTVTIVNAAANKLNLPLIDLAYDPAKYLYSGAEAKMLAKDFSGALKEFLSIYKLHPESNISAQALYAGGWILENELRLLDSAAVVYDTLITRFPQSSYTRDVAKKITAYKQEIVRRQKEKEDSLKVVVKVNGKDSLKVVASTEENEKLENKINPEFFPDEETINQNINQEPIVTEVSTQTKVKLDPLWNPRKRR